MSNEPDRAIEHAAADTAQSPYGTLAQSPEDQYRAAAVSSAYGVAVPGFEIEGELGRGGMGVVYRAKQTGLNRPVALKMVIAGAYSDLTTRTRFLLEAESVAALEHPNIVKVFSFGEHDGHPFLAMEFLPGGNLADRVKSGGPLPPREATTLMAKVAAAVAHAHTRGVVHRDIKPANVLLTADGDPRLTDFGLAKVGRSDLSMTGQVLGTPAYMAPEQAAGRVHEVGTPADVYALGAVLYDLLTGRPPFAGDSAAATLHMVLSCEPERLRKHEPGVPRDLETICMKCLEREPEKRYPTAQALADDLNRFLSGEPITARPTGSFERALKWVKRHKGLSAGLFVAALAVVLGVGASTWFGLQAMTEADRATNEAMRATGKANDERQAREQAAQSEKRALAALGEARSQRITADRRQAELGFSKAMTSCEEGRVQDGLEMFVRVVELAEANAAAEEPGDSKKAKDADRELARVARLNIAAWQRELPPVPRTFTHPNHVMAAEFLPDGKRFVTASTESHAALWDATTGEKIRTYTPPRAVTPPLRGPSFWSVAPSPDGKLIAVGASDGQITIWDTESPTHRMTFDAATPAAKKQNETNIFSMAFAPDGTLWAVDGEGGIQQWDLTATPKPKSLARLAPELPKGANPAILNVFALSPDGKTAYTGDRSGTVREWKLDSRTAGHVWFTPGWVQDLAVSPDGSRLAVTGPSTKVRVLDLRGTRQPFDIDLFGSYGNGVAFAPDQPLLVTADNDGNIRFWHQDTGQSVGTPIRLAGDPRHTRFRPRSDQFVVPVANAAYVCSVPSSPKLVTLGRGGRVRGLDISSNGERIASADDSFVDIFDAKTLQPIQNAVRANGIPRALRFDGDVKQSQVFRGYVGGFDRVAFPNGTQPELTPTFGMGAVHRIEFRLDRSTMYLLGDALIARFNSATLALEHTERPIKNMPPGVGLGAFSVRHDGGELLVTNGANVVFLDPVTLLPSRPGWATSDEIRDASYSRDGRAVLIGRRDNVAELLAADTGLPVVQPMPHARAVAAVAVSPAGTVFATGSRDNTARYWDSRTGLPVGPPLRHQSEVIYAVFDPNGSRMATGTSGGHVLLWETPPQPAMGSLEELRTRIARPKP